MCRSILTPTILSLALLGTQAIADDVPAKLPWQAFLNVAGSKSDCQFTFELATPAPKQKHPNDEWIKIDPAFASIDDLVKTMSTKLYWMSLSIDERHPRVIHVIDKRLTALKRYSLEEVIDVDFVGTPEGLGWFLNRQLPLLQSKNAGDWRQMFNDDWTDIAVSARHQKVRRILTDAVPRACYNSVLWRAESDLDAGNIPATTIQFYGLKEFRDDPEGKRWPWWEWLKHVGKPLDCFFTIETIYRSADDPRCCPTFFDKNQSFESVDDLLATLSKEMPNLVAVKDANRPEVIHIIDKDLLKLPGYALTRRVDLDYQGTPAGFAKSLQGKVVGAGPKLSAHSGMAEEGGDTETEITVRVHQERLRQALTDGIPLPKTRSRVLWHARTWVKQAGPETEIEYPWPR